MSKLIVIEIVLDQTNPKIWRKVVVSTDTSFHKLHHIIQLTMGWKNAHLYEFTVENYNIGEIYPVLPNNPAINSREITLNDIHLQVGEQIHYLYDMGDHWKHTLTILDIDYLKPVKQIPYCITGKLNCPPEDCGGIKGFYEFVSIITNYSHKDFRDNFEWYGGFYNPEKYSTKAINKKLLEIDSYIEKIEREE